MACSSALRRSSSRRPSSASVSYPPLPPVCAPTRARTPSDRIGSLDSLAARTLAAHARTHCSAAFHTRAQRAGRARTLERTREVHPRAAHVHGTGGGARVVCAARPRRQPCARLRTCAHDAVDAAELQRTHAQRCRRYSQEYPSHLWVPTRTAPTDVGLRGGCRRSKSRRRRGRRRGRPQRVCATKGSGAAHCGPSDRIGRRDCRRGRRCRWAQRHRAAPIGWLRRVRRTRRRAEGTLWSD
jgi:hypothetical protein